MKKLLFLFAFIALALISCEKEPVLTLSVEQITAPANGNSTTVTVTTNNPWTVSGNDWCTVSPSSGDGGSVMVTVSVKENTTYDPRNCTLTFMSKDLTASISVAQETNYGILLPKNTFEISSEAQQISVEVKANVEYDITINADWITLSGTKALSSTTLKFDIAENTSYDGREGGITIKEKNGNNAEFVKIIQAHKGAFVISSKEYNLSCIAQTLEVKLQTNVDVEVFILGNAGNWISYVGTKALNEKALCFNVSINEDQEERDGQILVKGKNLALTDTIRISQAGFTCSTIVYTTTDNRVLVINNAYFDVVRKSNVYDQEKGEGIITFNGPLSEIKSRAFEQCDRLKSIKIKAEINRIEDYTFYFCKNLENVEIPKSVTSIGEGAFYSCKRLKSIEIPECVTNIEVLAFENCSSLKSIQIPKGVTKIENSTFSHCENLESIEIPKGLVSIGRHAFMSCRSLQNIELPESVTSIGEGAFRLSHLRNIKIPKGVTVIEPSTFEDCYIERIEIPSGVTSIGDGAFYSCDFLKSVKIPEGVTSIGENVFSSCGSLESIEIPESVTSLGVSFSFCQKLSSFSGKFASSDGRCLIDNGVLKAFAPSMIKRYIIPNDVAKIEKYVFWGSDLESIEIPESVTNIGENAFEFCSSLKSIQIPKGVTKIESGTFANCRSLESVEIPIGVTIIGAWAFEECYNLKNVKIPEGVTSIWASAFEDCKSLESIEFPKSITDIAGSAFSSCANLKTITVKATNVPTLGTYAFYEIPYDSILRVPKGCKEKYEKSNWREFFRNIVEIE